jgi:hypothetical protein
MGGADRSVRGARQIADSERRCVAAPDTLKVMTMPLEAFGGWPGVFERLIRRGDLSGDDAAAAPAALLRSLGLEKATVVFELPPAT